MLFSDSYYKNIVLLFFVFIDYLQFIIDMMNVESNNDICKVLKFFNCLLSKFGMIKENWQLVISNFEIFFIGFVGCFEMMENFVKCC